MIRRSACSADGSSRWVLISQVEHARLAGEMAANWGRAGSPFERLSVYPGLIKAVFHHDDGWVEWERSPTIDPQSGAPRDFLEMPLSEALVIWERSISAADYYGPLAGYIVSSHFCALLRRGMKAWTDVDESKLRLAEGFLAAGTGYGELILRVWTKANPIVNTEEAAHRALAWLQLFDQLSLWLCCRPRTEPLAIAPPAEPGVVLTPQTEQVISVSPWPFDPPHLELRAIGRSIAARRYASSVELAEIRSEPVELTWRLVPEETRRR